MKTRASLQNAPSHESGVTAKKFWWFIGLGALFLVLGTGNLLVGNKRAEHYRDLLRESQAKIARGEALAALRESETFSNIQEPEVPEEAKLEDAGLDDSSTEEAPQQEKEVTLGPLREEAQPSDEYVRSIEQRYEYYQLCILGSKYFLAMSALLFLAALFSLRSLRGAL